jgi:hypothetical protein
MRVVLGVKNTIKADESIENSANTILATPPNRVKQNLQTSLLPDGDGRNSSGK